MNETYSAEFFKKELSDFRALLGQKSFWSLPDNQRQGALKGLGIVYLRLHPAILGKEAEKLADWYYSAVDEYTRREILLISSGLLGKSPRR